MIIVICYIRNYIYGFVKLEFKPCSIIEFYSFKVCMLRLLNFDTFNKSFVA